MNGVNVTVTGKKMGTRITHEVNEERKKKHENEINKTHLAKQ